MIRIVDVIASFVGVIVLFPLFVLLAFWIKLDSKGPIFFNQQRVGRWNSDFFLHKLRTMHQNSESKGQLTVGGRDPRITNAGYFLRKYKLDELPQLLNVLKGEMSLVGPRPEVRRYVNEYNKKQRFVLNVKPGITDYASIIYVNENDVLSKSTHPEKTYIEDVMPAKIELNKRFIENPNLYNYLKIITLTLLKVVR